MKSTFLLLCLGFRRVTGMTLEVTWVCDKATIISCSRAANISNCFGKKSYFLKEISLQFPTCTLPHVHICTVTKFFK